MRLYVELDGTAEVIEAPEHVVAKRCYYRNKFLDWLYNPRVKHKYRVITYNARGELSVVMCYGAEAFVEWLNKKVLQKRGEKAEIVETDLEADMEGWKEAGIPYIFFQEDRGRFETAEKVGILSTIIGE